MTARQFVLRFACACGFLLACMTVFNRVVDPFWYYRDSEIEGFNAIKPLFGRYERDVKPALLMREQPEAIVLGSSFSEMGFDPAHPSFTNNGQLKSTNFAMAGSTWQMVQCEFEFAVTHAHIKRALVLIMPGEDMPTPDCANDFPHDGLMDFGSLLLSTNALKASYKTVLGQKKELLSHTRSGIYYGHRFDPGVDKRFKEDLVLRNMTHPKCVQTSSTDIENAPPMAKANHDLSGLQSLMQTAEKNQVELVLYAMPRHAFALELDQQCGIQQARWQALKQIALLNKLQNKAVPLWQFYAYNGFTAEAIGNTAVYWQDSAHFNVELGNLMMSDMFNPAVQPTLGKPVSSQGIDKDYRDFLRGRLAYLKQHPEFQANLKKISGAH